MKNEKWGRCIFDFRFAYKRLWLFRYFYVLRKKELGLERSSVFAFCDVRGTVALERPFFAYWAEDRGLEPKPLHIAELIGSRRLLTMHLKIASLSKVNPDLIYPPHLQSILPVTAVEMQRCIRSEIRSLVADVDLRILLFPDHRKDVAGAVIDHIK